MKRRKEVGEKYFEEPPRILRKQWKKTQRHTERIYRNYNSAQGTLEEDPEEKTAYEEPLVEQGLGREEKEDEEIKEECFES